MGGTAALLSGPWLPLGLLLAHVALAAFTRPFIGGLDTPALAAAWEVARSEDWLRWRGAGGGAADLPPLLPWALALGWSVLGVGPGWPWLLTALALAAALILSRRLATELWPQRPDAPALASWVFVGSAGPLLLGPAVTPQALAAPVAVAGLIALCRARSGRPQAWIFFALCLSALLLGAGWPASAGLLVPALLGPAWAEFDGRRARLGWYAALALAAAVAPIPWIWIEASAGAGWAGRIHASLLPLLVLPLFLYPWPFWPRFWRSARRQSRLGADPGVRFSAAAVLAPVLTFCLAGAEATALLLIAPAACVLTARLLSARLPGRADFHAGIPGLPLALVGAVAIAINTVPWAQLVERADQIAGIELPLWVAEIGVGGAVILFAGTFLLIQGTPRQMLSRVAQIALLPSILAAAMSWEMTGALGRAFDLEPMGARIAEVQSRALPVATLGLDPSDYAFAGRLEQPLIPLPSVAAALAWARENPEGSVLAPFAGSVLHLPRQPTYAAPQGASWVALWPAEELRAAGATVLADRP